MSENMDGKSSEQYGGIAGWINHRLPIFTFITEHLKDYKTPKNLNYMWNFGSLAGITLVIMILTGIFLAMHYTPHVHYAFDSVERIMREVNYGWLIRYIHMNGASMFFIVVYMHIFRGLYYGSYKAPRELLWIIGVFILLLMMATAFMGYVLPWGQMSYWGATVITNLFSAIPFVGDSIVTLLWGGFSVDNPTLNRFFSLHYLMPMLIVAFVLLHLMSLHRFGSNNPTGVEKKTKDDTVSFHPYYTVKDLFGLGVFLTVYALFVFFAPNFFGEPDNYIPADPLVTPVHIVPEWYFLPFYAILRSIPDKLLGVIAMFSAIFVMAAAPWLDRSPVRSARYRPWFRVFYVLFVISCLVLGWAGAQLPEGLPLLLGRLAMVYYFAYFLVVLPVLPFFEKTKALPESISASMKCVVFLASALASSGSLAQDPKQDQAPLPKGDWSFNKPTGTFDKAAVQRGLEVYIKVCAACHSLKHVRYGKLTQVGLSEKEVKAIANDFEVPGPLNDDGEPTKKKADVSDSFASPYPNDKAARAANNGALPPDLSLMVKARVGGADYVYNLLIGYDNPPDGVTLSPGMHYNKYFPGNQIAMASQLNDEGQVTYADGTRATVNQMAKDVTTFLAWASEPELEVRKRTGIMVMIFLAIFTGMMYFVMRRIWSQIK
jgi:ubiquinol-cytochrome c reductase cytochrome b/c1 subunit